jgi:hypothetical protein
VLMQVIRKAFDRKDLDTVFEAINSLFESIPNQLWQAKNEHFYHALIHLTFQLVGVYLKSEVNTSRGRCDTLVETSKYVYAIEFKLNGDAKAALQQVHDKGYLKPYAQSGKELIAIGVNFTSERKGVSEWLVG